ncbi:MAG: mannose-phosphate guanylyltransferase / phosphomannomutase, partial [Actinomycetota bacterium]|nr:mannose-phosphate guanylyltransferase / phosphomannomutase [Actinomycetota bacterium]
MSEVRSAETVGVVLVGGKGERARPITVKAEGYLRSKAAMSICGKRLIVWLLEG